jgi:hypothetical protein
MQRKRSDTPTNVIDLDLEFRRARDLIVAAKTEPERWWSPGRFKTKPAWYVGHPFGGVIEIQHDVRTAEDWVWLTQRILQLQSLYEARTGRELPEDARDWCEDAVDRLGL